MIRRVPVHYPVRGSDNEEKEMEWRSYSNYLRIRKCFLNKKVSEPIRKEQLRKKK